MNDITDTLKIFKARFAEIALILGLNAMSIISAQMIGPKIESFNMRLFLFASFAAIAAVLAQLLNYGFIKTAQITRQKTQLPHDLIVIGRYYFWPMVIFALIFLAASMLLSTVIFSIVHHNHLNQTDMDFTQAAKQFPISYSLAIILPMILFAKPLLLIPAIIIGLDCKLLKSFALLKNYRLRDAKNLLIVFAVQIILTAAMSFLPTETASHWRYAFLLIPTLTLQLTYIAAAIIAIRFITPSTFIEPTPAEVQTENQTQGQEQN